MFAHLHIWDHIIGKQNSTRFIGRASGGVHGVMCIPALPGRKVSIVYLYTVTTNKKPETEGVEFRILGRSGPLCKEGLGMLA